jgi:hypothetical protein
MNVVELIINAIDNTHKGFTSAITNTADLQKAASAMATVVVAELTAAAVAVAILTDKAIQNAAEMGKMAQRIGEPVQELSKFAYAANIVGIANETMEKGFKKLDVSIAEAAGNMESKSGRAFTSMGIHIRDVNDKVKSQGQILLELSDKFAGYQDGATKSALAAQIFGERIGTQLIPLLNKGAAGVQELMSETSGVSAEFAKQAIDYEENVTRMQKSINAIGKEVAQAVLPYLVEFTNWIVRVQREYGIFSAIGMTVVDVLKGLAVAVYGVYTVFQILGKFIADVLYIDFESLYALVKVVIDVFKFWYDIISALVDGFINLGETAKIVGNILVEFFSGNFKEAGKLANTALDSLKANMVDTGKKIADSWQKNSGDATKALTEAWDAARSTAKLFVSDVEKDFTKLSNFSLGLWTPKPKEKEQVDQRPQAPVADDTDIKKREQALRDLENLEATMRANSLAGEESITAQVEKVYTERMNKIAELEKTGALTWDEILNAQLMAYEEYTVNLEKKTAEYRAKILTFEDGILADTLTGYAHEEMLLKQTLDKRLKEIDKFNTDKATKARLTDEAIAAYEKKIWEAKLKTSAQFADQMGNVFGNIAATAKAFGKSGFEAYKQFAAAQALMNTYSSAVAAYNAMAGIPFVGPALAVVAAAAAVAAGLANVAQIESQSVSGVAHGGLDYVPREGTYLLSPGEGVLKPEENAARLQGRGGWGEGQVVEMTVQIDGETLARQLFRMAKSGRLQLQIA